jgi:hypothetical protein
VTPETPLLETNSASIGQVADQGRMTELPVVGGNPFQLVQFAPGVVNTTDLRIRNISAPNATSQRLRCWLRFRISSARARLPGMPSNRYWLYVGLWPWTLNDEPSQRLRKVPVVSHSNRSVRQRLHAGPRERHRMRAITNGHCRASQAARRTTCTLD